MWPNLLEWVKVFLLISVCTKVPPIFIEMSLLINFASPVLFSFYQGRSKSEAEGPLVKVIESFLARAGFQKLVTPFHPQAASWSCFLINFSKINATLKAKRSRRHLYGGSTHFSNGCIANLIIKKKKKKVPLGPSISEVSSLLSGLEFNRHYETKCKLNMFNKSSTNVCLAICVWLDMSSHSHHKV